jgi:hypothetical protein
MDRASRRVSRSANHWTAAGRTNMVKHGAFRSLLAPIWMYTSIVRLQPILHR